ncbi:MULTISPECIES: hypothetical protein [Arthrobacter]|nr:MULTISPECIES: hypothetical protein [Arthrobacter]MBO0898171.1 hypothetical protein [Arthrobacter sunyaminii]
MAEKEHPASGNDQDRTHNEAPSEGDSSAAGPNEPRQHSQEAAEGDDDNK